MMGMCVRESFEQKVTLKRKNKTWRHDRSIFCASGELNG